MVVQHVRQVTTSVLCGPAQLGEAGVVEPLEAPMAPDDQGNAEEGQAQGHQQAQTPGRAQAPAPSPGQGQPQAHEGTQAGVAGHAQAQAVDQAQLQGGGSAGEAGAETHHLDPGEGACPAADAAAGGPVPRDIPSMIRSHLAMFQVGGVCRWELNMALYGYGVQYKLVMKPGILMSVQATHIAIWWQLWRCGLCTCAKREYQQSRKTPLCAVW